MVKVSVIVPIYQVESYLVKCLDSLVHQTLKEIEIIHSYPHDWRTKKPIILKHKMAK